MKLLRSFPMLAFALVLLSIVGVCIAQRSVELLLVAGALAALSWSITEGPRGRHLPRWVCSLLLVAASLSVLVDFVGDRGAWMGVLGRYTVWITLIKLYDRKTPRDYGQLLILSLLLMVIGAVQSNGLLFGIVLLVYAVLGAYVLLLFQLHAAHERAKSARTVESPRGYNLVPNVKPIFGRHLGGQFQALTFTLGSTAFVLGVIVFLIFPRGLGEGVVPVLRGGIDQRVGFSESIDLRTGRRITDSRRPVLNIQLTDMGGRPIRDERPIYLRGAVLDRYQGGGEWRSRNAGNQTDDTVEIGAGSVASLLVGRALPAGGLRKLAIDPYTKQRQLFSPLFPVGVDGKRRDHVHFDRDALLLERHAPSLAPYTVIVQAVPDDATLAALTDRKPRARRNADGRRNTKNEQHLRNDRVRALGESLLERRGLPLEPPSDRTERYRWNRDVAEALRDYFHTSGFEYTLDLGDVRIARSDDSDDDPVRRFLFDFKRGHCEYFASGFAALAYNLDVRAHVVVGYVAYGYDDTIEGYTVLDSNAHAWVEVETAPGRWSTFDPTPPADFERQHGTDATLADRLSWIYERFEGSWRTGFVAFDSGAQREVFGVHGLNWLNQLSEIAESTREWLSRVNRAFYFGPAGYIWMGVVAFALVLAVTVLIQLMRRTRRLRRTLHLEHVRGAEHHRMLRQLGFYLDMLQVLHRARLAKPDWCPPLAHAGVLATDDAEVGRLVEALTARYYAARFGGDPLDREAVREASSQVDELARHLGVRRRR